MKLQKRKRKTGANTYFVSVPRMYKDALGWSESQNLRIVINQKDRSLKMLPSRGE